MNLEKLKLAAALAISQRDRRLQEVTPIFLGTNQPAPKAGGDFTLPLILGGVGLAVLLLFTT